MAQINSLLAIRQAVKAHYETYVYPQFPLLSSVRRCDTYALNLKSLWSYFNGERLDSKEQQILLAGCGGFSPYPTAVANPNAKITALDLSSANLQRAKFHTLLHFHFNVDFITGDLGDASIFLGKNRFHFIDCYGVLHHIPDVCSALRSIHSLLKPGAFVRMMVYSHCARKLVQSAAKAMRILRINNASKIRDLYKGATDGSRFRQCVDSSYEAGFDWGLADLFLHPYAKTYRLDELLSLLDKAHLEPLLFTHQGASSDTTLEIEKLRALETNRLLSTNFILFAGRTEDSEIRNQWQKEKTKVDTFVSLNPVIKKSLPLFPFRPLKPDPKLGFENPPIDVKGNFLLSRFKHPVKKSTIDSIQWQAIQEYLRALFLIETID